MMAGTPSANDPMKLTCPPAFGVSGAQQFDDD
jgi:hypothetical protein